MTIKIENPKIKEQIIQRLSRIEGQIRGVQKMISEDRDCKEIIQQLLAERDLSRVFYLILFGNIKSLLIEHIPMSSDFV
jgi:DNA-binding FrmR family transcriptional regulator